MPNPDEKQNVSLSEELRKQLEEMLTRQKLNLPKGEVEILFPTPTRQRNADDMGYPPG